MKLHDKEGKRDWDMKRIANMKVRNCVTLKKGEKSRHFPGCRYQDFASIISLLYPAELSSIKISLALLKSLNTNFEERHSVREDI